MIRFNHATPGHLLPIVLVLALTGCAPLRTYGRTLSITQQCIAADELRRGEEPRAGPGSPAPVTPADSLARSTKPAAEIKCNGGLSR